MSGPRLIQNFRGFQALIVAAAGGAPGNLAVTLERLGLQVAQAGTDDPLLAERIAALSPERDVVFVDGDLGGDALRGLGTREGAPAVPVIGLVGAEAPSRLRALFALGATALLRKPVHGAAVYSALYLGINAHRQRRHLLARLAEHDARRRGRRFLVKAVLQLVQQRGMTDDEAYAKLRRESMRARLGVEQYCETLCMTNGTGGTDAQQDAANRFRLAGGGAGDGAGAGDDAGTGGGPDQARHSRGSIG